MAKNILDLPWEAIGGTIQTTNRIPKTFTFSGKTINLPLTVAVNIGDDVARHLTELHNQQLVKKE